MKKIPVVFFSFLLLLSCGSNQKKSRTFNSSSNCINVVEIPNGFSSAYTADGHTIIYETDSANNHIVYYAKFDDYAGKKGYDRVKDKAVRIVMDSSLNMLKSFVSVHGGASFQINDSGEYQVYYFDEQMNGNNAEIYEISMEEQSDDIESQKSKIKRIIYLLTIAHKVADNFNERNVGGWNYIVSALEPSHGILNHDIMSQDTVFDPKAKEHISKLSSTTEGLTQLYLLFQERSTTK